jgi:hypothetical protein
VLGNQVVAGTSRRWSRWGGRGKPCARRRRERFPFRARNGSPPAPNA